MRARDSGARGGEEEEQEGEEQEEQEEQEEEKWTEAGRGRVTACIQCCVFHC